MRVGTKMNLKKRLVNMKGDLSGAVSAAILSILIRNLALEMSDRLRIRTNEVRVLEEG
jgi:hypothetical protein